MIICSVHTYHKFKVKIFLYLMIEMIHIDNLNSAVKKIE